MHRHEFDAIVLLWRFPLSPKTIKEAMKAFGGPFLQMFATWWACR